MKKVAMVLCGCGVFDGSEIHEAVLTLLALEKCGAEAVFFAPDVEQKFVMNHIKSAPANESRNALLESARIARGKILDLEDFDAADFDALVFPGGFGVAQTLSSFAFDGENYEVSDSVKNAILAMKERGKAQAFVCIAPVLAAKVLGGENVLLTIGSDKETASHIEKTGAKHIECKADSFVEDKNLKVFSTPAYMLDARLPEIEQGIFKMIEAMLK